MQNALVVSRYKLWVIGLYIVIFPLFFIFIPSVLRYDTKGTDLGKIFLISIVTFLGFYFLNLASGSRKIRWQSPGSHQIVLMVIYALLFAIPEEIIFRGIIQGALQNTLGNTGMAVIAASAIFGLAHLPNGARGWRPRDWTWGLTRAVLLVGLPLGLIFAITGSLLFPTLLHAFFLVFLKLFTSSTKGESP